MIGLTLPLLTFALISTVSALPNVTAIRLNPRDKPSCTYWPGWINTRDADTTGSLNFTISGTVDDAINGLPAQPHEIPWGSSTRNMLVMDLLKSTWYAKYYFRCNNGQAVFGNPFHTVTISKDVSNAHMLVDAAKPGYGLEVYGHEIDGVRQEGVYLGAMNQTTWGFRWMRPDAEGSCGGSGGQYFEARLFGLPVDPETPPTAGYNPMLYTMGFLKVSQW